MRVTIDGRTYFVFWQYIKKGNRLKLTKCYVKYGEDIIAVGKAKCCQGDCPLKNVGRKLTLSRALLDSDIFGKQQRVAFWNAYLEMRHGKWI